MSHLHEQFAELRSALLGQLIGQEGLVDSMLLALLCNGHILLEGSPGTAKTRAVKLLAQCIQGSLGRIQFTPDLLPADVTGAEVFHQQGEQASLQFEPGPVFNNLILADEINRAPAKVQSALLEAMQERQVTVAAKSYPLPDVFMVIATQNPIEQEGTYPLPEAQMDRFLLKTQIHFPTDDDELSIIRLVRREEQSSEVHLPHIEQLSLLQAQQAIADVHVDESIEQYIVALIMATREPSRYPDSQLADYLLAGASPRASIALDKCARARAWLHGRDHVLPEDVQTLLPQVVGHRLMLSYKAQAQGLDAESLAQELLRWVVLP